MALDPVALAVTLKLETQSAIQATLPPGITLADSASIDAFYAGVAQAIVLHLQSNAEVHPGTLTAGATAVTGVGTIV